MVERKTTGAHVPSRRGFAGMGLAGLAGLLAAHRVEAAPYLGGGEVRPAAANGLGAVPAPMPDAHAAAMVVDVRAFGARGDGAADDAPAINAAIHSARERRQKVGAFPIGSRIVLPTGIYAVDSSIDLTGLRDVNTVIDGCASAILGRCAGRPVIDAIGSRWLTVRDLTILGDPVATPDIGIQIGVQTPRIVADDQHFEDVKVLGHFTRACLYNRAAETSGFDHVLLWNFHPDSFCLIQDGVNHFGVTSQLTKADFSTDINLSFNENVFINCDFRHGAAGTPVWLGDTARHAFIRCYAATDGPTSFVVYCGQHSHVMLDVDCHCETDKLRDAFLFTGRSNRLVLYGFAYRDHRCNASRAALACDDHIEHVDLQNVRLELPAFRGPDCMIFAQPERWTATGSCYSSSRQHWNGDDIFTGMVTLGMTTTFSGLLRSSLRIRGMQAPGVLAAEDAGVIFRDPATNKLLVWTGSGWVDALGNPV